MNKDLSTCEAQVMKVIWDQREKICISQLVNLFQERYKKNYSYSTLITLLRRLINKGYISVHRSGNRSYIHVEKDMDEHRSKLTTCSINFWYDGSLSAAMESFMKNNSVSKEEIKKIRNLLSQRPTTKVVGLKMRSETSPESPC